MANIFYPSRWYNEVPFREWVLTKAGHYEEGTKPDIELRVSAEDMQMLIHALDEAGWIKPRLDERLRAEDLKITHRLLDLLEKEKA